MPFVDHFNCYEWVELLMYKKTKTFNRSLNVITVHALRPILTVITDLFKLTNSWRWFCGRNSWTRVHVFSNGRDIRRRFRSNGSLNVVLWQLTGIVAIRWSSGAIWRMTSVLRFAVGDTEPRQRDSRSHGTMGTDHVEQSLLFWMSQLFGVAVHAILCYLNRKVIEVDSAFWHII